MVFYSSKRRHAPEDSNLHERYHYITKLFWLWSLYSQRQRMPALLPVVWTPREVILTCPTQWAPLSEMSAFSIQCGLGNWSAKLCLTHVWGCAALRRWSPVCWKTSLTWRFLCLLYAENRIWSPPPFSGLGEMCTEFTFTADWRFH
jgi:hypothetical protein